MAGGDSAFQASCMQGGEGNVMGVGGGIHDDVIYVTYSTKPVQMGGFGAGAGSGEGEGFGFGAGEAGDFGAGKELQLTSEQPLEPLLILVQVQEVSQLQQLLLLQPQLMDSVQEKVTELGLTLVQEKELDSVQEKVKKLDLTLVQEKEWILVQEQEKELDMENILLQLLQLNFGFEA